MDISKQIQYMDSAHLRLKKWITYNVVSLYFFSFWDIEMNFNETKSKVLLKRLLLNFEKFVENLFF